MPSTRSTPSASSGGSSSSCPGRPPRRTCSGSYPWRHHERHCLFCRIAAGEIPATKVHDDDLVLAIRDIAPRAPTHILLLPREHIASAADLTETHAPLLGRLFAVAADLARAEGIADRGYRITTNVGAWGGQSVAHLHLHLHGRAGVRLASRVRRGTTWDASHVCSFGRLLALTVLVALAAAGCATRSAPVAEPIPTPHATPSPAVVATQVQLETALRARGLVLQATDLVVRPGDPPSMMDVPRTAFRAVLPDDPEGGLIVVYELADPGAAAAAAADLAAYVTSGPGRVQHPPDTRFVIRQVGSTIVFVAWSPASSPDPRTAAMAAAVASVGTEVPIPGD